MTGEKTENRLPGNTFRASNSFIKASQRLEPNIRTASQSKLYAQERVIESTDLT